MEVETKAVGSSRRDVKKTTTALNKKMNPANKASRSKVQRPDIQLYVPRGRRMEQHVDATSPTDNLRNSTPKTSQLESQPQNYDGRSRIPDVSTRCREKYSAEKVDRKEGSLDSYSRDGGNINSCKNEQSNTEHALNGDKQNSEKYHRSVFNNIDIGSEMSSSNGISNYDSHNLVFGNIMETDDHIIMLKENNDQICNDFNNQSKVSDILLNVSKHDRAVPEGCISNAITEDEYNTKNSIPSDINKSDNTVILNDTCKVNSEQKMPVQTILNRVDNSVQVKEKNRDVFSNSISEPVSNIIQPVTPLGSKKQSENKESCLSDKRNNDNKSCYVDDSSSSGYSEDCDVDCCKEDSWDALYDDSGEHVQENIIQQLTKQVDGDDGEEKTKINYLSWKPRELQINDSEYGHVVEIYDFPGEFKTQDLIAAFSDFRDRYIDVQWVDDTHALCVFSSPNIAQEALVLKHPFMKIRPLSEATALSKTKARQTTELLQPSKPRPATSASLARRLVTGALGLRVQVPKEQRDLERQKLKEAKERRRLAVKQREDAWNGTIMD